MLSVTVVCYSARICSVGNKNATATTTAATASIMKWPASISHAVSQIGCKPWAKLARYRDAAQRLVRSA
jgi:hypothetical protein